MQTITDERRILTDTGLHFDHSGWHRTVLVTDWNEQQAGTLAKVEIHVAQHPSDSHLRVHVWTIGGFAHLFSVPTKDWWHDMPGYQRRESDKLESKSAQAINMAVTQLVEVATSVDLDL